MTNRPPASSRPEPRHFSMIRKFALADFVTLGNGFAGTAAILSLMQHLATGSMNWLWFAFGLLPIAFVLDALDGKVARWRYKSSALGADLDSLADVISFGVAPAALAFAVGMRGSLDVAILLYFVGCGISRLARFNVTAADMADESGKVRYYEGMPIPTSLLLVAILAVCAWQGRIGEDLWLGRWELGGLVLHPLSLIYFFSGSAMISKTLRIPKF
jgi:CDP-diacylglycerol---serine O-phosphatidyltransferase